MTAPTFRPPDSDLDRALEHDRGEFGAIYRRLPRAEPPKRLDRAILAEATRAVHGRSQPRAQRWLLGVGSAAGVLLAAGIAWRVNQEINFGQPAVPPSSSHAADEIVPVQPIGGAAGNTQEATNLAKSRDLPATNSTIAAASAQEKLEAERTTFGQLSAPPARTGPARAKAAESKPGSAATVESQASQAMRRQAIADRTRAQPVPDEQDNSRRSDSANKQESSEISSMQQAETQRAYAPSPAKSAAIDHDRKNARAATPVPPPPARAKPASPTPVEGAAPPPQAFPAQAVGTTNATLEDERREDAMAAPEPETSAPASMSNESRIPIAEQVRRNSELAPNRWLTEIIHLHRAGRLELANQNMRAFHLKYPRWQLPQDFPDDLRRIGNQ